MIVLSRPRKIPNCEGYYISSSGNVWCDLGKGCRDKFDKSKRKKKYKLKPRPGKNGYLRVYLRNNDGIRKDYYIHQLVAEAYIPKVEGKPFVNHKNCDRTKNHYKNLEWCTAKENNDYTMKVGNIVRDEKTGRYRNPNK